MFFTGEWSSPALTGTRPPHGSHFTLTSIDRNRAILFAGQQPGHGYVNDTYLIDFSKMVSGWYMFQCTVYHTGCWPVIFEMCKLPHVQFIVILCVAYQYYTHLLA